ncbi:hypothetical protein GQ53DRAFT_790418 [Thozetella sp. PMI_491]|nr:hypothetical protein GQ53DRAFT_790418 [Thozetella sp. PMI_491]
MTVKPAAPTRLQTADLGAWKKALASSRPVLTHLNADTTWLIQLPLPASERSTGRTTFNILIDPWLQGPQSDVASWFSTQWHVVAPSIHTMAELNTALARLEQVHEAPRGDASAGWPDGGDKTYIDAVVISHEFTDHCHRATLEELPKNTPVFATEKAAALIRSWRHFDRVITTPGFSGAEKPWKQMLGDKTGALPPWLGIGRVVTPGNALYYHSAVMIVFELRRADNDVGDAAEAIIYSPHGIKGSDLECIKASGMQTLALLHGLHDVQIWKTKQLNLGGLNGADAVRASGARYWIATHDEVKKGGGLVSYFLRRKIYSPGEAAASDAGDGAAGYEFLELGSGDGVVLE